MNDETASSTVTLFESSGGSSEDGLASAYSVGLPVLSHSRAKARAASKSRACAGGRNFVVDSRTRDPFRVPRIRIGHLAPLPAQLRRSIPVDGDADVQRLDALSCIHSNLTGTIWHVLQCHFVLNY
jgi:hypothetical protein